MKFVFYVLGFCLLGTLASANESTSYTTRSGHVFTRVMNDPFGIAWQAPDGSVWSQYQGLYSNQGNPGSVLNENGDRLMLNSDATKACERIGGKLPLLEEYQTLTDYFMDRDDFLAIFPFPQEKNMFWTANERSGFARYVKLPLDPFGDAQMTEKKLSVMCRRP